MYDAVARDVGNQFDRNIASHIVSCIESILERLILHLSNLCDVLLLYNSVSVACLSGLFHHLVSFLESGEDVCLLVGQDGDACWDRERMAIQVDAVFTECQRERTALEDRVAEADFLNVLNVLGECDVFLQFYKLSIHQYWVWSFERCIDGIVTTAVNISIVVQPIVVNVCQANGVRISLHRLFFGVVDTSLSRSDDITADYVVEVAAGDESLHAAVICSITPHVAGEESTGYVVCGVVKLSGGVLVAIISECVFSSEGTA